MPAGTSLIKHLAGCSEVVRSQHSIGLIWVRRPASLQDAAQANQLRVMMCFQPSCQKAGKLQGKNFSCLSYLLDGVA